MAELDDDFLAMDEIDGLDDLNFEDEPDKPRDKYPLLRTLDSNHFL